MAASFLEGLFGVIALSGFLSLIICVEGVTLLSLLPSREVLAVFLALLTLMRSSDFNESLDSLFVPAYFSLLEDIELGEMLLPDPVLSWPLNCLPPELEEVEGVEVCFLPAVDWTELFLFYLYHDKNQCHFKSQSLVPDEFYRLGEIHKQLYFL